MIPCCVAMRLAAHSRFDEQAPCQCALARVACLPNVSFATACTDTSLKVGIGPSHCRKTCLDHETDRWSAEPAPHHEAGDWRSTVHLDDDAAIKSMPKGQPWTGSAKDGFDIPDPQSKWAGWVTSVDAVSGKQH